MVCYICGAKTDIFNSRTLARSNQTWRRRRCVLCDTTFTTTETIDYTRSLVVSSPSRKQLQPLQRDRLMLSLYKSLGHRPTALADAGGLCATILAKLTPQAQDGVLSSQQIVQTAMVALSRFDKLAAQHYQAFHKH